MSRPGSIPSPAPASDRWPLATVIPQDQINLDATLLSGQAFCWRRDPEGRWHGWIGETPCRIEAHPEGYRVHSPASPARIERYLGLTLDLPTVIASFPADPWLAQATAFAPGLRLLAQEPWETLASFICSAVKQIPQIEQINQELRRRFGPQVAPGLHAFPSPAILAQAGEAALRACKLGFRARGLHQTARQLVAGEVDLQALRQLDTAAAREQLVRLSGVGPKIADCTLLFGYGRQDAFPVDVWVERVLRQLYFKGRKTRPERLRRFLRDYFGPHPGYAQQYLFHWVRTTRPAAAMGKPKTKAKARLKRA